MNEQEICNKWNNEDTFQESMKLNKNKPEFKFYEGPPFYTGDPHYGHIAGAFIKDTILRHKHNQGYHVERRAGADTHGLPIEYEIEKRLNIKTTDEILEYGIGNYNEKCRDIVMECADTWKSTMSRLGRWIDFDNDYKTMTKSYMNSVWWTFSQLYKNGHVYEGVKIMPYSTSCATSLSNFETGQNHRDIQDISLYVKFELKTPFKGAQYIAVWTTTPWTLPSNYALCVNPDIEYITVDDCIYAESLVDHTNGETFLGSELKDLEYIPLFTYNTFISKYKIVTDTFVKETSGTGIVHIAPTHGEEDYNVCIKNNIITKESKLYISMDDNGFMIIPEHKGVFYKDFNKKVIMSLKETGNYIKTEQITHSYPFCWRSDTPLIYKAVNSWFIKVEDIREKMLNLNETINWKPSNIGSGRFKQWLSSSRDWGFSRSRFWGCPIPIWRSEDGDIICVESSYELEELTGLSNIEDLHRHFIDDIIITKNGKEYKRIPEVFDCWYESACVNLGQNDIVELLRNSDEGLKRNLDSVTIKTNDNVTHKILPADFIAEGLDQTRGWFYTQLVISTLMFDIVPFKNVIVNGIILANDGKKMSKRLKNYPDPLEVVDKYGSDALRLYLLSSPLVNAESIKFSEDGVKNMNREVIIQLKNSLKFFEEYYTLYMKNNGVFNSDCHNKNVLNLWILRKYHNCILVYYEALNNYDLNKAVITLMNFVQVLNNGFIRYSRPSIKNGNFESIYTLYIILKYISYDFRAITPFLCETIYLSLTDTMNKNSPSLISVHLIDHKLSNKFNNSNFKFDIVHNIICNVHQIRSLNQISLKKPIKYLDIVYDKEISHELLEYIHTECNVIDINILKYDEVNVTKTLIPVKSLFFKRFGKKISDVFNIISKNIKACNSIGLNLELPTEIGGFEITEELFNINYETSFDDHKKVKVYDNMILAVDFTYDENVEILHNSRVISTKIQESRKNNGLHPWDNITFHIETLDETKSIIKYNIENISKNIRSEYSDNNNSTYTFDNEEFNIRVYINVH